MKFILRVRKKGMTLIEMIVYVALLSFLMAGFVDFAYTVHVQDLTLSDHMYDETNK